MTYDPAVDLVLAHHPLLTAVPFVVPAVLVVALVGGIIWRDRREDRR
jgi:hypothetical protein